MTISNVNVIKRTGEREPFSEEKIRTSIQRACINPKLQELIISYIKTLLYEDIPTSEIYQQIITFLNKTPELAASAKYSLKQAIMEFGPSGYPFEKFIAAVLSQHGYRVATNQILQGKCVSHEIDVIAQKNNQRFMIEAKFHNRPGVRSDIKTALYTWARFNDLYSFNQAWLVTNTKVTADVKAYARCMGMRIISWNYPDEDNLRNMIEKVNLHPITALNSLSKKQKTEILKQNIVLCSQLTNLDEKQLINYALSPQQAKEAKKEALAVISF